MVVVMVVSIAFATPGVNATPATLAADALVKRVVPAIAGKIVNSSVIQ